MDPSSSALAFTENPLSLVDMKAALQDPNVRPVGESDPSNISNQSMFMLPSNNGQTPMDQPRRGVPVWHQPSAPEEPGVIKTVPMMGGQSMGYPEITALHGQGSGASDQPASDVKKIGTVSLEQDVPEEKATSLLAGKSSFLSEFGSEVSGYIADIAQYQADGMATDKDATNGQTAQMDWEGGVPMDGLQADPGAPESPEPGEVTADIMAKALQQIADPGGMKQLVQVILLVYT